MSRSRWLFTWVAMAVVICLLVAPRSGRAVKPQLPSRIIGVAQKPGSTWGYIAVASDGAIYDLELNVGNQCLVDNLSSSLVGRLFEGLPPAPIVAVFPLSDGLLVSLENGDIYGWCSSATPSHVTVPVGNIFASAGRTRSRAVPREIGARPMHSIGPAGPATSGVPEMSGEDTPSQIEAPGIEK